MAHFDDAKALVDHAKQAMPKLVQDYQSSLNEKTIKPPLLIDIKNIMENLRSALDFAARGLFTKYGNSPKPSPNIYFPYALLGQTQWAKPIENCIPGITLARPDIVTQLKSYQHYSAPENKWLPLFMELNNENKHEKLTPQTRQEAKGLRIASGDATMTMGPGASTTLGQGASIKFGDVMIPGGQEFSGERPANYFGSGTQTVINWVSFTFDSNGEQVVPFLERAITGVEKMVDELGTM